MNGEFWIDLNKRVKRLHRFLFRNIRDLRGMDRKVRHRKLRSLLVVHLPRMVRISSGVVVGLIVLPIIRLARPLVLVRIGSINTTRLGHMLIDVEMATAELETGVNTSHPRTVDIWFPWTSGLPPANTQLLKMWKRSIRIGPAFPLEGIAHLNGLIPGGTAHKIPYRKGIRQLSNFNDVHGALRLTKPHLKFSDEERSSCVSVMSKLGIGSEDRVVCFHVRSARYLKERLGAENSSGHDFRDASLESHYTAMLELCDRGYKVVRMGMESDEPLLISHENLIDYAQSGRRSELMDLFIPSVCEFFVGVLSGPSHIAQLFRRPLLLTNLVPLSRMMLSMDNFIFIPKQLVDNAGNRLGMREVVLRGLENISMSDGFNGLGLTLIDNSPEEVVRAVVEMASRCSGDWVDDELDRASQERFLSLVPDYLRVGAGKGTIASSYLRTNEWFLD